MRDAGLFSRLSPYERERERERERDREGRIQTFEKAAAAQFSLGLGARCPFIISGRKAFIDTEYR
jgi:hypothetical protein